MMMRREKVALTLAKRATTMDAAEHRTLCSEIADDLNLAGYERQTFMREAKASAS